MARLVTVYSRKGCHLCEVVMNQVRRIQPEFNYEINEIFIDENSELRNKYGEEVPVIHIDNKPHDFFRVDEARFRTALNFGLTN